VSANGGRFQISAPADTTTRTLTVYLGALNATGTLNAHLSDGSAMDFNASYGVKSNRWNGVCTITYRAASAGQTITVTLTQTSSIGRKARGPRESGGGISVQAAALAVGGI
jgi:hypothetical protein